MTKIIDWKFKNNVDFRNDDFWYDLFQGGYLIPSEIISDKKQVKELIAAMEVVGSFYRAYCEKMDEQEEQEECRSQSNV